MDKPKSTSAAVKNQSDKPAPRKLKVDDIEYLALEGGGGKGFAYLGAIDILEKIKGTDGRSVMARVKGFAGASAGAITALLLSIGYDFKELTQFLGNTDFDSFYDAPTPRIRPQVGSSGVDVEEDSPAEQAFITGDMQAWVHAMSEGSSPGLLRKILATLLVPSTPPRAVTSFVTSLLTRQVQKLELLVNLPTAAKVILHKSNYYFAYLPNDMGLFSGQAARTLFESLLQAAAVKKAGGSRLSYRTLTFQQHWDIFKKRLLVTGTNLRTGQTQLFSKEDTPNFPVADAIRISMSLPWVFKPYIIRQRQESTDPPCGVYVDGGVWNNLPFRELDGNPPVEKPAASAAQASTKTPAKSTPRTLGLRLAIDPAPKIDSVIDLTLQMLSHGLVGSGESQVLDKYVDQCIVLDTRGLDLLTFSPPKDRDTNLRILNRSRRAVCRYFDLDINVIQPSIRDDADDEETLREKQKAETCDSG